MTALAQQADHPHPAGKAEPEAVTRVVLAWRPTSQPGRGIPGHAGRAGVIQRSPGRAGTHQKAKAHRRAGAHRRAEPAKPDRALRPAYQRPPGTQRPPGKR